MSHRPGLTPQQNRVLDRLEDIFPNPRSAEEVASDTGIDVRSAMLALQELLRRRLVHRGPKTMSETPETELYVATNRKRI